MSSLATPGDRLTPTHRPAGLYLHVPFCRKKCLYCDFYSEVDLEPLSRFVDAVSREAQLYKGLFASYDSLYLGGGTPSLLDTKLLEKLLNPLFEMASLEDGAEITLEVNPADITPVAAKKWGELGINRLSVGVQSFHDPTLEFLCRRHDSRQAREALDICLDAGFFHVSCDLLTGLPSRFPSEAPMKSLETALETGVDHVSLYLLTVAPNTPLGALVNAGQCRMPSPDRGAQTLLDAWDLLLRGGFQHYEVSNFAKGPQSIGRHNSKYWDHSPYLGLGPGAHSFDGTTRWWKEKAVHRYTQRLLEGEAPPARKETLTPDDLRLEKLMLGLRTSEGVPESLGFETARETVQRLLDQGYLVREDHRLVPTSKGLLVADALARELM